jgi:hypothetical protein
MRSKSMMSLLFAVAVASCGGDGISGPARDGTGNVSASGAVSASGEGLALFQSVSVGGTSLFQIAVQPTAPSSGGVWQLQIVRYAARLPVGTYQLTELSASSQDPTANFYYTVSGTMEMFAATSGELIITSSSSTAVRGTFTFIAESTTNSARTVTVQGAFAARCPPGTTCQ